MLEDCVDTFNALCTSYTTATLAADHGHAKDYDEIISLYAAFASKDAPIQTRTGLSVPLQLRCRSAGLKAIKSLVSAESFEADNGRQLRAVLPAILQNLYSEDSRHLSRLLCREKANNEFEQEQVLKRKNSISNARSTTDFDEPDPTRNTGTTEDIDERAEEEVGVLAMQCLRQIFIVNNRVQLRTASDCLLSYSVKGAAASFIQSTADASSPTTSWAADVFEQVCHWTPVQDRFVILFAATEYLSRLPVTEDSLTMHLSLVRIVSWLLRSSANFIGLSVIDVLDGFVQHLFRLLQIGKPMSRGLGMYRPSEDFQSAQLSQPKPDDPSDIEKLSKTPSNLRTQVVQELKGAIGDLASHIYYLDQVGDMIAALFNHLKAESSLTNDASAQMRPTVSSPEDTGFFTHSSARIIVLEAIVQILIMANSARKDDAGVAARNKVDVSTFDGTQWLLKDSHGLVRKSYVQVVATWAEKELDKSNLRLPQNPKSKNKWANANGNGNDLARRAFSNSSRYSSIFNKYSSFIQLLHVAIYDHALQYAESGSDTLLLHSLLARLVTKLGINSVRHGLPMIFRMQEDVKSIESLIAKDNIGSLVQGYFWCLSHFFGFETTATGRNISMEVRRRMQHGLWLKGIVVPATAPEDIEAALSSLPSSKTPSPTEHKETLRPFDARHELVECISEAYSDSFVSPPSSPPASPGLRPRSPRSPPSTLSHTTTALSAPKEPELPEAVHDELLAPWTRESSIAAVEKRSTKSSSLTGSGSQRRHHHEHHATHLKVDGGAPLATGLSARNSESSSGYGSDGEAPIPTVEELKQVLETGQMIPRMTKKRATRLL